MRPRVPKAEKWIRGDLGAAQLQPAGGQPGGRINAYFGTTPGPFQITKPPQGEQHPRGFVQSTVLKTITEHPQGMTNAEIITELGPQGIGGELVAKAVGELVQAKKISSPGREGKYLSAASEVPNAPDQPSS